MSYNLSILFIALTAAMSLSMCCPITCAEVPNLVQYLQTSEVQRTPLQVKVNVSTTRGLAFQPNLIPQDLKNKDGALSKPNGCSGFYHFTSKQTGVDTVCPWSYQCDFDPQRIPAFLFHARCNSTSPTENMWEGYCEEVYYPISYMRTESCDPLAASQEKAWSLVTSLVPVSCNLRRQDN